MDANFWQERWKNSQIGFHQAAPEQILVEHLVRLALAPGSTIFVPLCGKSLDMRFLVESGYSVVGAELSALACEAFFRENPSLGAPRVTELGGSLREHRTGSVRILQGDFFELTPELFSKVDAIYDRAALVALPKEMRARYATQLLALCGPVPQLCITFSYDQDRVEGPPFSVSDEEVRTLYEKHYSEMRAIARNEYGPNNNEHFNPRFEGTKVTETGWLLSP